MAESNGDWGALATDELQAAWDSYSRLPESGENRPLDSFLERKHLDLGALVRLGARLSSPNVLAVACPGGIKFRDHVTDRRWSWEGSSFDSLKVIPGVDRETCLVTEGETDTARLTMVYDCDVAMMPAGARNWRDSYTAQVQNYRRLLVALDADEAGEDGWQKIKKAVSHAQRFAPPAADWCEVEGEFPALPGIPEGPSGILVAARELLTLEVPDHGSWFQGALLPIAGSMVMHGTFKSFKTWMALDMASALAQGGPWAGFEHVDEPARVAYFNFEVPWLYYRERVQRFKLAAKNTDLFLDNFLTPQPLARPRLTAGNEASEAAVLNYLIEGEVAIVFLDPVRRAMGFADMNAENEVRRMLAFADRLTREGITVVLLHHDNKESDRHGGGDPSGMTGSGAWAGDVDSIVSISRPPGVPRESGKRNLRFLLRNAPSPPSVGFELMDDGGITWHPETWVEAAEGERDL